MKVFDEMKIARVSSQFLAHLQIERTLSANTLLAYKHDLKYYEHYLGSRNIFDFDLINKAAVSEFIDYLHGNINPYSAERNEKNFAAEKSENLDNEKNPAFNPILEIFPTEFPP
ncbi:site-specific integrase [Arcanobacterium hippocoleae]